MKEKITFNDSQNNKVVGILSNPHKQINIPIVILTHGFGSGKDRNTYTKLESILNKNGYATLRFDFFGHGESDGKFEEITVSKAVEDTKMAIKVVEGKGFSQIVLLGTSFGGNASILTASSYSVHLSALILRSAVSDYKSLQGAKKTPEDISEWKNKGYIDITDEWRTYRLNYSFFEDISQNDEYESAKKINIPTLIIHGDEDKTVPVEQSERLHQVISQSKLFIVHGAGHRYTDNETLFNQDVNAILNFLKNVL